MKKIQYIVITLILLLIPTNISAKSINLDTKCTKNGQNIECKVYMNTNKKIVKGVTFNYSDSQNIQKFEVDDNWTLNKSDNSTILLVTKSKSKTDKMIIGKITMIGKVKSICLNNVDIVYQCKDKYCDFTKDSIELKLNYDNNYKIAIIITLLLILSIICILIKKNKKTKKY